MSKLTPWAKLRLGNVTTAKWLPIRYREFHDVPRAIVVEYRGDLYFLSCLFDEEIDDYPEHFSVYRLPEDANDWLDDISDWSDLTSKGVCVGTIRVADVRFDDTKRKSIDDRALNFLSAGSGTESP